jgi:hypothetical protein
MADPDYRALCAELLAALEIQLDELRFNNRLCVRARASLAQPKPVAPTDEEIAKIIFGETYYAFGFDSFPPAWGELEDCLIRQCCVNAARAVLARWGTSANNTSEEN